MGENSMACVQGDFVQAFITSSEKNPIVLYCQNRRFWQLVLFCFLFVPWSQSARAKKDSYKKVITVSINRSL
jgi:hypothetical protein